MKYIIIISIGLCSHIIKAQISIGTTNPPQGALDVVSDDSGVLLPRLDTLDVVSPIKSMLIYHIDTNAFAYYDGTHWRYLHSNERSSTVIDGNGTSVPTSGSNDGAVKVNLNQNIIGGSIPGYITIAGERTFQNILQNGSNNKNPGGIIIDPTYATGEYPFGHSEPTDVITGPDANATSTQNWGGVLFEAPYNNQANFYRVTMSLKYNNGASGFTDLQLMRIRVNSIQSGALVYANSLVLPSYTIVGQDPVEFQIFYQTIADANSINTGYQITFDPIGSLGGNVDVNILNIVRVSAAKSSL